VVADGAGRLVRTGDMAGPGQSRLKSTVCRRLRPRHQLRIGGRDTGSVTQADDRLTAEVRRRLGGFLIGAAVGACSSVTVMWYARTRHPERRIWAGDGVSPGSAPVMQALLDVGSSSQEFSDQALELGGPALSAHSAAQRDDPSSRPSPPSPASSETTQRDKPRMLTWLLPVLSAIAMAAEFTLAAKYNASALIVGIAALSACLCLGWAVVGTRSQMRRMRGVISFAAMVGVAIAIVPLLVWVRRDGGLADQLLADSAMALCLGAAATILLIIWGRSPQREAAALAVLVFALGGIALDGLGELTTPVSQPATEGSASLFVREAGLNVVLDVSVTPAARVSDGFGPWESMVIKSALTPGIPRDFSWLLVLVGDSRIPDPVQKVNIEERTVKVPRNGAEVDQTAQFISGRTKFGRTIVSGHPVAGFERDTASRRSVGLPGYNEGFLAYFDDETALHIRSLLGGEPAVPLGFSATLDCGELVSTESVQAQPPLQDPTRLRWSGEHGVSAAYVILDQEADDRLRNALFGIAVLLGAAASGFFSVFQSAWAAIGRPNDPTG
jgi:hypothetical protein